MQLIKLLLSRPLIGVSARLATEIYGIDYPADRIDELRRDHSLDIDMRYSLVKDANDRQQVIEHHVLKSWDMREYL